ncbi:GNAT family N-acetyltransferase [Neobacillus pocheonensis]|uniref:GNAT family N-acetyltransferase n=1 Tax=Neobacillus pocheonensis TaxID=363869 RepID=UPI003D2E570D
MIKEINFRDDRLVKELYELQRASYRIEADLINFYEIPPLVETIEELKNCGETFIGYFVGDELAGAISFTNKERKVTICRMVVHPNHLRKGIAQELLACVEINLSDYTVINVSTGKDNTPAKNLYLKNGFHLVGDIEVVPGLFISNFEKRKDG